MRLRLSIALVSILALQGGAFAMGAKPPKASEYLSKLEQEGAVSRCAQEDKICSLKAEELARAAEIMTKEGVRNFQICPVDPKTYAVQPEAPAVSLWIGDNAEAYYLITREGWRSIEEEDAEAVAEAFRRVGTEQTFELPKNIYVSPDVYAEIKAVKTEIRAEMEEQSRKHPYERLLEQFGGGGAQFFDRY